MARHNDGKIIDHMYRQNEDLSTLHHKRMEFDAHNDHVHGYNGNPNLSILLDIFNLAHREVGEVTLQLDLGTFLVHQLGLELEQFQVVIAILAINKSMLELMAASNVSVAVVVLEVTVAINKIALEFKAKFDETVIVVALMATMAVFEVRVTFT